MNKYKIECAECTGTGVAENIGGWARPCDACHGEGDVYVELEDKMSLEEEEQLYKAISSAVYEVVAELGIDALKSLSMFNGSKEKTVVDVYRDTLLYIAEVSEDEHVAHKALIALEYENQVKGK